MTLTYIAEEKPLYQVLLDTKKKKNSKMASLPSKTWRNLGTPSEVRESINKSMEQLQKENCDSSLGRKNILQ